MTTPLNVLIAEDSEEDAELVVFELGRAGFAPAWKRVDTEPEFRAALEDAPDIILADHTMPRFSGLRAADLLRESGLNIPFILISGTMGEDAAVEAMKRGVTDYLLKDRITRLGPAVRRALQEVEERARRGKLEAQFIEAQKMEVVGQLASGVAHDFNNILMTIMGNADLLRLNLGPDSPLHDYVGEVRHASERAAGLTRQLLVFSRKEKVKAVVIDLNEVVRELEKMLRRLIGEDIEMTVIPGDPIGCIRADSGYIGQVLMNLAVNARDAMPNGGKLTIATNDVTLDESCTRDHPDVIPGEFVMLSVSDTGTGMTPEVKARLFEAFFTTKPKGKGTGLGLATCQTIVQQSGGHIGVYSEPGIGTTFKIYFPRVGQLADVAAKPPQNGPLPRGTETLMVVEDESSVRRLACEILRSQGYNVLSGSNGQEALRVAREHRGGPIHLVVTDVVMPVMGGKVMAEWLKDTYPGLKILFTSGYTDDALSHHGVGDPGVEFLAKPYGPATLARKVRGILDKSA